MIDYKRRHFPHLFYKILFVPFVLVLFSLVLFLKFLAFLIPYGCQKKCLIRTVGFEKSKAVTVHSSAIICSIISFIEVSLLYIYLSICTFLIKSHIYIYIYPPKVGINDTATVKQATVMEDFLRKCGGYAVIDGGLATELERYGADLNDPLWSAKCLLSSPELIRRVHLDYLEAGANIIISASYQATLQGCEAKGMSKGEGEALLRKSVEIACQARDIYYDRAAKGHWDVSGKGNVPEQRPVLIAASVGSYGAYLADGSEYSGIYGDTVTLETLKDFHRRRVQILAEAGADIIAFETIPNKQEAKAYAELLEEEEIKVPAWFSFNSKDGINVVSGDSISECASIADSCKQVVAVGINCTPPRFIHGLIQSVKKITSKPILLYPNSGEMYDGKRKDWVPSTGVTGEDFVTYVGKWREAGASLIGGCCRTTPNTIRDISKILAKQSA